MVLVVIPLVKNDIEHPSAQENAHRELQRKAEDIAWAPTQAFPSSAYPSIDAQKSDRVGQPVIPQENRSDLEQHRVHLANQGRQFWQRSYTSSCPLTSSPLPSLCFPIYA